MTRLDLEVHLRYRAPGTDLEASFSLSESVASVTGTSGSGKTTLLDLLAGILRPDRGSIRFHGEALVDVEKGIWVPSHRRGVAFVPAGGALFPHFSLEENLAFGVHRLRSEVVERFQAAIQTFELAKDLPLRPKDLDRRKTLHGAVARALISFPRLVLLEQPEDSLHLHPAVDGSLEDLLERIQEFDVPVLLSGRNCLDLPAGTEDVSLRDGIWVKSVEAEP